jgi:hypothetical protein
MFKSKKLAMVIIGLMVFVFVLSGCSSNETPEPGADNNSSGNRGAMFTVVGTSSVGGSYYLYGGGLSAYMREVDSPVQVTAQTTKGSYENARILGDRIDIALSGSSAMYERTHGLGQFEADGPADNIRGIMTVDTAPYHWITLEGTGIESIQDLVGKKVSIGEPGSGAEGAALALLDAYGITDQVQIQNLGYGAAATALRDGQISAFVGGSAIPMPAIVDLAATRDVALIPVDADIIEEFVADNPSYMAFTIPAGSYSGVDEDVLVTAVGSLLVADKDTPEDTIYEITKTMMTDGAKEYMKNVYFAWGPDASVEYYEAMGIEMHPGALKYYKEAGIVE